MEKNTLTFFLIVAVLGVITAGFLLAKVSETGIFPGTVAENLPPEGYEEQLKGRLESTNHILELALPLNLAWDAGQKALMGVGVKNTRTEEKTFFFAVVFEGAVEAEAEPTQPGQWILLPRQKAIPAGGIEVLDAVIVPQNPPRGLYNYRILVCETGQCQSLSSPGIYATATFSFRIL